MLNINTKTFDVAQNCERRCCCSKLRRRKNWLTTTTPTMSAHLAKGRRNRRCAGDGKWRNGFALDQKHLIGCGKHSPHLHLKIFSFFGISFRDFDVSKMAILRIKMRQLRYILKMGEARPLFCLFSFFSHIERTNKFDYN